jgi:hypothetical protein
MARGEETGNHPNRRVHRERYNNFSAALDARQREYEDARAGRMTREQASRVGIDLTKVQGPGKVVT